MTSLSSFRLKDAFSLSFIIGIITLLVIFYASTISNRFSSSLVKSILTNQFVKLLFVALIVTIQSRSPLIALVTLTVTFLLLFVAYLATPDPVVLLTNESAMAANAAAAANVSKLEDPEALANANQLKAELDELIKQSKEKEKAVAKTVDVLHKVVNAIPVQPVAATTTPATAIGIDTKEGMMVTLTPSSNLYEGVRLPTLGSEYYSMKAKPIRVDRELANLIVQMNPGFYEGFEGQTSSWIGGNNNSLPPTHIKISSCVDDEDDDCQAYIERQDDRTATVVYQGNLRVSPLSLQANKMAPIQRIEQNGSRTNIYPHLEQRGGQLGSAGAANNNARRGAPMMAVATAATNGIGNNSSCLISPIGGLIPFMNDSQRQPPTVQQCYEKTSSLCRDDMQTTLHNIIQSNISQFINLIISELKLNLSDAQIRDQLCDIISIILRNCQGSWKDFYDNPESRRAIYRLFCLANNNIENSQSIRILNILFDEINKEMGYLLAEKLDSTMKLYSSEINQIITASNNSPINLAQVCSANLSTTTTAPQNNNLPSSTAAATATKGATATTKGTVTSTVGATPLGPTTTGSLETGVEYEINYTTGIILYTYQGTITSLPITRIPGTYAYPMPDGLNNIVITNLNGQYSYTIESTVSL